MRCAGEAHKNAARSCRGTDGGIFLIVLFMGPHRPPVTAQGKAATKGRGARPATSEKAGPHARPPGSGVYGRWFTGS